MVRNAGAAFRLGLGKTLKLDFGELPTPAGCRRGLRLAASGILRGPEKYRELELKRRRAQIRARRVLELD
jgi:hypothetical protein